MLFKCLKQDSSRRMIFILQAHPSKGVQKNMLKSWNFTKINSANRCFDSILWKIFRKNILENGIGEMVLMLAILIVIVSQLTDLNFKQRQFIKNYSIFTCCRGYIYVRLNFKNRVVSTCRDTFWTQQSNIYNRAF